MAKLTDMLKSYVMSREEQVAHVVEQNSYDEGFTVKGFTNDGTTYATPLTQKDSTEWLSQLNNNPRLSGVNKIISDNGVAQYGVYIEDDERGKVRVRNHPLVKELNKATVPMFFSLWTAYRYMTGTTYIAYNLDKNKHPTDFQVFTTTHLAKTQNKEEYAFNKDGKVVKFPKKQVIVDYDIEPNNPYGNGFGKAASLMNEVEADSYILKYIMQFYVNSARPDALIVPVTSGDRVPPTSDELKHLVGQLRDFHKGWQNSHKMAVLGFEARVETIQTNHREMELLETRRMYRDASHQHFGIPPEIVGIVENSNKATVVAAEHIYAKQVRLPILIHFQDIINSKILPLYAYHEGVYFEFDDILTDDLEINIEVAAEAREATSITINEHRELLGFPRIQGEYGKMMVGTKYDPNIHGEIEVVITPTYESIEYSEMLDSKSMQKYNMKYDEEFTIIMEE